MNQNLSCSFPEYYESYSHHTKDEITIPEPCLIVPDSSARTAASPPPTWSPERRQRLLVFWILSAFIRASVFPVPYLSLHRQFLLQVLYFGFIPENLCLELLMSLKREQNINLSSRGLCRCCRGRDGTFMCFNDVTAPTAQHQMY